MKCVLLAGGLGTRLSEETVVKPKPMVEIGGKPILWHIMKVYSHYGINEFIICLGYKGYLVKEYFANYFLHMSDVTFDMQNNQMEVHSNYAEPWKVTLINTGDESMTGGRLKYAEKYVKDDEAFCFTYGDGLSDVNVNKLIEFHKTKGKLATLTAVTPPGRFGALDICENLITNFKEKPKGDGAYINGGFFVLSPKVIDLIDGDSSIWENEPLETLAANEQLSAFIHDGFWQPMDTLRDKHQLESLWQANEAPWKLWK
ncbi:MAG TPA: glucose-1-phosphate cytidylyltransferase [Aquella sp.]|nr:glucose-1-phosphate cytidylyltransferase [Aquella sp.]